MPKAHTSFLTFAQAESSRPLLSSVAAFVVNHNNQDEQSELGSRKRTVRDRKEAQASSMLHIEYGFVRLLPCSVTVHVIKQGVDLTEGLAEIECNSIHASRKAYQFSGACTSFWGHLV